MPCAPYGWLTRQAVRAEELTGPRAIDDVIDGAHPTQGNDDQIVELDACGIWRFRGMVLDQRGTDSHRFQAKRRWHGLITQERG